MFITACSVLSHAHAVAGRQLGPEEKESHLEPDGLCVCAGTVPPPSLGVLIWEPGRLLPQEVILNVGMEQSCEEEWSIKSHTEEASLNLAALSLQCI